MGRSRHKYASPRRNAYLRICFESMWIGLAFPDGFSWMKPIDDHCCQFQRCHWTVCARHNCTKEEIKVEISRNDETEEEEFIY